MSTLHICSKIRVCVLESLSARAALSLCARRVLSEQFATGTTAFVSENYVMYM